MTASFDALYLAVFASAAIALVLFERIGAWQRQPVQFANRWTSNIGLFISGSLLTTIFVPVGVYAFALHQPPGLMTRLGVPMVAQMVVTFLLLDCWRYWEHRVYHRVPLLWRLHLVHHSDTQVDVTTSERHHPLDALLGTAVMFALVSAFGLPAPAVGLYLLVATVVALYSHANLRLPASIGRVAAWFIVTAPVHAVHHSDLQSQTDSNFGSVLTLWDRFFGTYVDPARSPVANFGLRYFHQPRDTRFARVLLQPFLFRRDIDYPARLADAGSDTEAAAIPAAAMTRATRDALLGAMAGCLLLCLVMWPTLVGMVRAWRSNEAYQYAWLIVPMIAYVIGWHRTPGRGPLVPEPGFEGVFVVIAAAACWSAATLMNIDAGREFAFVLALQGIAISALGWRCYRSLFPALALLFLMIPSGDLLQPALRVLTVKAIDLSAAAAQLPHSVDGFVIFIGTHRYIVVDECSGLAYVTLAGFLGYCFGLLLYRSFTKVAALALLGALLGIVSNVLRVDAIVFIDWWRDSQMDLAAHGTLQWIALFATLGLLFYVLSRLDGDAPTAVAARAPSPAAPAAPAALRKFAPVFAGLSGLLIAGSAVALPDAAMRSPHATPTGAFPTAIVGWQLANSAVAWSVDAGRDTESIALTYVRDGRELHALIVAPLSPTAKLRASALAPRDGTWREKEIGREAGCTAGRCIEFVHSTWLRDKGHELRHVYHAYSIGGLVTDSTFTLRAAHGWHRLQGDGDNPRMFGFVVADGAANVDELAAALLALRSAADNPAP